MFSSSSPSVNIKSTHKGLAHISKNSSKRDTLIFFKDYKSPETIFGFGALLLLYSTVKRYNIYKEV